MTRSINFSDITGPVYVGRARGEALREHFHMDDLDDNSEPIKVMIPAGTYTVSSSFFLGLFGPSILKMGSKEAFYRHYQFESPKFIAKALESYVSAALIPRSPLI